MNGGVTGRILTALKSFKKNLESRKEKKGPRPFPPVNDETRGCAVESRRIFFFCFNVFPIAKTKAPSEDKRKKNHHSAGFFFFSSV